MGQRVSDDKMDEPFGELVRAVVVGAAGDQSVPCRRCRGTPLPSGPLRPRSRDRGRAVGVEGVDSGERALRAEPTWYTSSVDILHGTAVIVPSCSAASRRVQVPRMFVRRKRRGVLDGPVHVGLRGEVAHDLDFVLPEQSLLHQPGIGNPILHEEGTGPSAWNGARPGLPGSLHRSGESRPSRISSGCSER